LLKKFNINLLIDVRKSPSSRKFPHFNKEYLIKALNKHGIKYVWLGIQLGGWRKLKGTLKTGGCLKSPGFKAYTEHMKSEEFKKAANLVIKLAKKYRVALMCSEKLYFRCHRYFLSDWLLVHGVKVYHIIDFDEVREHKLSRCVKVIDGELFYD